jgi:hypothetical protein
MMRILLKTKILVSRRTTYLGLYHIIAAYILFASVGKESPAMVQGTTTPDDRLALGERKKVRLVLLRIGTSLKTANGTLILVTTILILGTVQIMCSVDGSTMEHHKLQLWFCLDARMKVCAQYLTEALEKHW